MNEYNTAHEQVRLLAKRNLMFKGMSQKSARKVLVDEANFYRLVSYKHYFSKYTLDENGEDDFNGLDFLDLYELYMADKILREEFSKITLDIEFYFKGHILLEVQNSDTITEKDYIYQELMNVEQRYHIVSRMEKRIHEFDDYYSKKMLRKYPNFKPIWVLHEYLSFGEVLEIMKSFKKKYSLPKFSDNIDFLYSSKTVRNLTVHGNKMFVTRDNHFDDFKKLQQMYEENFDLILRNDYFNNHFKFNLLSSLYIYKVLAPKDVFNKRMESLYFEIYKMTKQFEIFQKHPNESVIQDISKLYYAVNKMH